MSNTPAAPASGPASPALSYVMATRNKLAMLQETLPLVVAQRAPDEEIVVVDGASSDGSAEWLRAQQAAGAIDTLVSEPDAGEGHATSKGILLCRGQLIKFVTDDDLFHWPTVRLCREFMEQHLDVDAVFTDGAGTPDTWGGDPARSAYGCAFRSWLQTAKPFEFSGLGLCIRRASLPLLGLPNSRALWVDFEYSLRMTAAGARIAHFSGLGYLRIMNPNSNTITRWERLTEEQERLERFYWGATTVRRRAAPRGGRIQNARRLLRPALGPMRRLLRRASHWIFGTRSTPPPPPATAPDFRALCARFQNWLENENRRSPGTFQVADHMHRPPFRPPASSS